MERTKALKEALAQNYSPAQIENFFAYTLSQDDDTLIRETLQAVLHHIPSKAMACTQISAAWAAMIQDHSQIPVSVVCGDLSYFGTQLFVCHSAIPTSAPGTTITGHWDGHCWLEFGGVIADASIFRTIYHGEVPDRLKNQIKAQFGEGSGAIIGTPDQMTANHFTYVPRYTLGKMQIDGIITGLLLG
ncbi:MULTISPECIES: hypothetical protein [unclassified Pedobacter]|uniref:hypothetical protein n=1 Tax=unclassified Pedobacter TaxID=2628915 RepID=UPI001DA8F627|nr:MULTISPECIES: hypothetical protein [unclassified Pedobacter]CAH0265642.1 hypothetical protein SRABI36_03589 [Pedobacter sp. Bi36]CAH0292041.1 hypothetical protein SRABI126_04083 [Pedobacter sp. Bi126]